MAMTTANMPTTTTTNAASSDSTSTSRTPTYPNPLPLSASQEAQVKDIYHRRVRNKCANEIKEFADCARGRTVTATWLCRAQRLAMNSCMLAHATRAEEDAAREEWFQGREERRMKRELEAQEVERRRREVLELTKREEEKDKEKERGKRGWWG